MSDELDAETIAMVRAIPHPDAFYAAVQHVKPKDRRMVYDQIKPHLRFKVLPFFMLRFNKSYVEAE